VSVLYANARDRTWDHLYSIFIYSVLFSPSSAAEQLEGLVLLVVVPSSAAKQLEGLVLLVVVILFSPSSAAEQLEGLVLLVVVNAFMLQTHSQYCINGPMSLSQ